MKKIQFLGAVGGVTGSSYLVTLDSGLILVDLGMFQGKDDIDDRNSAPLPYNVQDLKAVFLTHAHLDHCGRLPFLVKQGYRGKIYTTQATKDITQVALLDSAGLAQEKTEKDILYTKDQVAKLIDLIETVDYDQALKIDNLTITFKDAGHILGSASIEIEDQNRSIIFSGDLGNTPEDLIQPTENFKQADLVVMESTYGDSVHVQEDISQILTGLISEIISTNGVLLIPAFSIERTQEILHRLGELKKENKLPNSVSVYVDSPMAIEVLEIFKKYPNLYNKETARQENPFDFANLTLTKTSDESKAIFKNKGPKIIIAGSGMMSGGRVLHHLVNYLPFATTQLAIVGYQAEGTLGRVIQNGAKKVEIYDDMIPVNAKITEIESLSSHADQPKLLNWLKNIQGVKKVFITHGEDRQRQTLSEKIKSELKIQDIVLPTMDQEFELSV